MGDKKQTRGTVESAPCPHCKKPNNLKGLADYGVEPGNVFVCDHCSQHVQIVTIKPVTLVWCRKFYGDLQNP